MVPFFSGFWEERSQNERWHFYFPVNLTKHSKLKFTFRPSLNYTAVDGGKGSDCFVVRRGHGGWFTVWTFDFWVVDWAWVSVEFAVVEEIELFFIEVSASYTVLLLVQSVWQTKTSLPFNQRNSFHSFYVFVPLWHMCRVKHSFTQFFHFELFVVDLLWHQIGLVLNILKLTSTLFQIKLNSRRFEFFLPFLVTFFIFHQIFYKIDNSVFAKNDTALFFVLVFESGHFWNFFVAIFRSIPLVIDHIVTYFVDKATIVFFNSEFLPTCAIVHIFVKTCWLIGFQIFLI